MLISQEKVSFGLFGMNPPQKLQSTSFYFHLLISSQKKSWRSLLLILLPYLWSISKLIFPLLPPILPLALLAIVPRHCYWFPSRARDCSSASIAAGMAAMIVVNSKFTASTFKHLHARGIRPEVLYPAVNVDQFSSPPPKFNFLSINRFERKKNIDLAITAFVRLNTLLHGHDLVGATLTAAGGYDKRLRENVVYLEELKTLAEKEGVSERVGFITSCSTSERNALLSECLCVLYTPTEEHVGIVPLEAMAAFRPLIACNSGPTETVKHGVTGFLCDPTPDEFAVAIAKPIQDTEMS